MLHDHRLGAVILRFALVILPLVPCGISCAPSVEQRQRQAEALRAAWRLEEATVAAEYLLDASTLPDSVRLLCGEILHAHGDLHRARDVLTPLAGAPSQYQGEARWLLAHTHFLLGQPDTARTISRSLLARALTEGDALNRARAHHVLGLTAFYDADYATARREQRSSLHWARQAQDAKAEADALRQLGVLAWYRGRLDSARTVYYEPALVLYRQVDDRIGEATTLSNIGLLHWERRNWQKHAQYQIEALDLRQRIGDQVGLADSYYFLAAIPRDAGLRTPVYTYSYLRRSADLSARIGYAWGLQIARRQLRTHVIRNLEVDHPLHSQWSTDDFLTSGEERLLDIYVRARYAAQMQHRDEALRDFRRASDVADSLGYYNFQLNTREQRLRLLMRTGRLRAAASLLGELQGLYQEEPAYSSESRGQFLRAELHLRQGRVGTSVGLLRRLAARHDSLYLATLSTAHPGLHVERAAAAVHGTRSRIYALLIEALTATNPVEAFSMLERERSLPFWGQPGRDTGTARSSLSRFVELLEELETSTSRTQDKRALRTALGEMRQAMLAERQTVHALMPAPDDVRVASLDDVQRHLDSRQVFVEYFVGESRLTLCAVRRDTMRWLTVPAEKEELEATVRLLRRTLVRGYTDPADTLWQPAAQRLHDWLIAPLYEETLLRPGDHLVVSPHRTLSQVPFAALIAHEDDQPVRFLIDDHVLSIVPSATAFVRHRSRPKKRLRTWVGMAPSSHGLPYTEREVRRVADLWPGSSRLMLGPGATADAVRRALQQSDVVHIAAHARMNTEMPLHAHVELHDRRLELYELMQAPIHTHLVVLSACETGRSVGAVEATPTSADHVSFPRAFLAAGAQTVIATHWAVEDTTTARLMQSIYDHLLGSHPAEGSVQPVRSLATAHLPIAEALAKAQREQIQYARKEGRSAHPIYWAGVALFGDGR